MSLNGEEELDVRSDHGSITEMPDLALASADEGGGGRDDAALMMLHKMLGTALGSSGDLSGQAAPPPTASSELADELELSTLAGYLEKRNTWTPWKRVYAVTRAGVLLLFRTDKSKEPRKRYDLSDYRVEDASSLTGEESFMLVRRRGKSPSHGSSSKKKKKNTFFRAGSSADTIKWKSMLSVSTRVLDFDEVAEKLTPSAGNTPRGGTPRHDSPHRQRTSSRSSPIPHAVYVDDFPDAGVISDCKGTVLAVNGALEALLGWRREEIVGENVSIFCPPEIAARHQEFMSRYLISGRKRLIGKPRVLEAMRKDGSRVQIQLCLAEVPPHANSTRGVEKEFQAELRLPTAQLETHSIANTVDTMVYSALQKATMDLRSNITAHIQELLTLQQESALMRSRMRKSHAGSPREADFDLSPAATESDDSVISDAEGADDAFSFKDTHDASRKDIEVMRLLERRVGGTEIFSARVDGWGCIMKAIPICPENHDNVKQLGKEIAVLEALPRHKNLVRYLCHRITSRRLEIFMTQYEGTLAEVLRKMREKPAQFSLPQLLPLLLDIASGLAALHDRRIMHRDLSSANIAVTFGANGDVRRFAIGDFDSAKQLDEDARAARHTTRGTTGYTAPEVLQNGKYSFPADIYSFGMLILETVTLQPPFHSERSPLTVAQLQCAGKVPAIPAKCMPSPQWHGVEKLYQRCTQLRPNKRPDITKVKTAIVSMIAELS